MITSHLAVLRYCDPKLHASLRATSDLSLDGWHGSPRAKLLKDRIRIEDWHENGKTSELVFEIASLLEDPRYRVSM